MVNLRILDHLEKCYTGEDGQKLFDLILPLLEQRKQIRLSFDKVGGVPSSFVNTAFIQLLDVFSFEFIKTHLFFVDTIKVTNDIIKKRFAFELLQQEQKKAA